MRMQMRMYATAGSITGLILLSSLPALAAAPMAATKNELGETATLNHDISAANAAADARYAAEKKQYDEEKSRNEAEQQHYLEQVKQNEALQQQYQDKLRAYQQAYPKTDAADSKAE